jgi:hypothetical protein
MISDTIKMKLPYKITENISKLIASISENLEIIKTNAGKDLKWAVNNGVFEKIGINRMTGYKYSN